MAVHKWWEVQRDHRGKLLPRKPNVWALKVVNTRTPDGRVVGVLVGITACSFLHTDMGAKSTAIAGRSRVVFAPHRTHILGLPHWNFRS